MRHSSLYTLITLILCTLISCIPAAGAPKSHVAEKQKTLLILNSYNEQALWSRQLVSPITLFVANDDNIHAEIFSLNNVLITDSVSYNQAKENLFETYANHRPDYLVIIGKLAFTLRDDIKAKWGDLPMLLITRDLTLAPTEYFFSGFDKPASHESYPSIAELTDEFNFTAIYVPDFYEETIDLMVHLIPDMNQLVFFSDQIFLNRNLAKDIELYLYDKYPDIKFKWVQATADRPDDLQYYFVHDLPNTGLLMSTWFYEKKGPFGYPNLVSGDMNLLNSSINPIFSLRQVNMQLGSIGGVFSNRDSVNAEITRVLEAMVHGKSMRSIKFITNKHNFETLISYPKLIEYGLNPKDCPKDTIFVDQPPTFWEKYAWQVLSIGLIFVLILLIFVKRTATQKREINNLIRHRNFVDKMPMPYTKAKVIYDDNNKVINVKYTLYNEAFEKILKANAWHVDPYWIFPNEFIAEKTDELIKSHNSISFKYHFDKTDTYYIFTLCFVGGRVINSKELVEEIDIFATDVTQREKNEEQLRLTTQKLDMTLNVTKLIPWEWRIEEDELEFDAYTLFNNTRMSFKDGNRLKNPSATVTLHELMSHINADDRENMRDIISKLTKHEITDFKIEFRVSITVNDENREEWVEMIGAVSKVDHNGNPTTLTGSVRVITDRKMVEKDLIEARERASESDKLKSAFLANMSHEIRTPLNAIIGFSSLLCETDDLAKRREFSTIINQNNEMLLALVNDVLDLAKIESNTLEMSYATVNLNNLMNTIYKTAKMRVHPEVLLNLVVGMPVCIIRTDGNRVSQVLMNLLTNAAKFTNVGSITFGYDVLDNREIYFYVKDTGIGISAENQKRLFKRFDKINNFVQGNGLGLSICKSIVEKLHGTIGMRSRGEGKGSTFWFTIPYEPVEYQESEKGNTESLVSDEIDNEEIIENENAETLEENTASTEIPAEEEKAQPTKDDETPLPFNVKKEGQTSNTITTEARQKVILVAEDMDGNFLLLKHLIPQEYKILHAWDGNEAVDMYNIHHPDIVLMDISMPIMDGYQATEAIRKINATVPIVAVTAFAYASDRQRILKSGFNDYISKPVIREDLLEVLKRYL